jgi:WD40 repeat protein
LDREGRVTRRQGIDFHESETLMNVGANPLYAKFSGDSKLLAVVPTNGIVQLWDVSLRILLYEIASTTKPLNSGRLALLFLPKINRLLIFDQQAVWHEWDLSSWRETRSWPGLASAFEIAVTSDETMCAALDRRGTISLRNLKSGQETHRNLDVPATEDVAFSADGGILAVASAFGLAKLWETATPRLRASFPALSGRGVHSVTFSSDGQRLAVGSTEPDAVKMWDLQSQQEVLTLGGRGSWFWLTAFSPDGNVIGSINEQGFLHLWRAPSWEEIAAAEKRPNRKPQ